MLAGRAVTEERSIMRGGDDTRPAFPDFSGEKSSGAVTAHSSSLEVVPRRPIGRLVFANTDIEIYPY